MFKHINIHKKYTKMKILVVKDILGSCYTTENAIHFKRSIRKAM